MNKYSKKKKYNLIAIFIVLVLFYTFMIVGYSLFTDTLTINGTASVTPFANPSSSITITDSAIDVSDFSKKISITFSLENITGDLCTVQYSVDGGTTWTNYIAPFKIYQTSTINARCIKNDDQTEIGSSEKEVKVEIAFFQAFDGNASLFGITGIAKNTIKTISRTNESLTLSDIQERIDNGENIVLISNTASDGYLSTIPIYGWVDASGNFYWWSEAETVYFHPNTLNAFYNYSKVTSIDLSGTNSSFVTSFYRWFWGDTALETINLNSLDTSNATTLYGMFYNCQKLTSLDVSSFNTAKVKNMASMFGNLYALTGPLDLSSFNTALVTDMSNMFNGSNKISSINMSSFDTTSVKNMSRMFASTSLISEIDVSNFNTSSVTNMYGMFSNMNALTTIYASNSFDTSKVTNSNNMFQNDTQLVGGNGTVFDTSHIDKAYARIDETGTPGYFKSK